MPSTWKLIIEDDAGKQIVVPFTRDVITIGRKEGNTIRLTERNVSRNHAKLSKDNGHIVVEDLKSFNGIKLNGDRIDGRMHVHEGDTIQIGDYHLALHAQDGTGADRVPTQNGHASDHAARRDAGQPVHADDDEFAGDTQRWEPPPGGPALAVGGLATTEDRAVSDEHTAPAPIVTVRTAEGRSVDTRTVEGGGRADAAALLGDTNDFGADSGDTERVTMDMLASMNPPSSPSSAPIGATRPNAPPSLVTRPREGDLEPTVRQTTSPPPISLPPGSLPLQGTMPPPSALSHATHGGETRPEPAYVPASSAAAVSAPAPRVADRPASLPDRPAPQAPPRTPALDAKSLMEEQTEAMRAAPGMPTDAEVSMPRLVVLNTIFAGSTFSLRAAEVVIGRTEDNDITIEHKSVSRNHAKVVREGDRVRILDLKSANGVLVNNEEVEQAVLRSGDVVELGRVRLRFAPIGERFVVPADEIERARIADAAGDDFEADSATGVTNPVRKKQASPSASFPTFEPQQHQRPTIIYIAGGALIVLAIIAIIIAVIHSGGGEKKESDNTVPPPTGPVVIAKADPPLPPPVDPPVDVKPVDVKPVDVKPVDVKPVDDVAHAVDPPHEEHAAVVEHAQPEHTDEPKTTHTTHTRTKAQEAEALNKAIVEARGKLFNGQNQAVLDILREFAKSDSPEVHRELALANAHLNHPQEALKQLKAFHALAPNAPDYEQVKKALEKAQSQ